MSNIILLATYWNEIEWIEPSLAQIDRIDPLEIIICDGCFDPNVANYSTDGTREIIKEFVSKRDNARMISALRPNKVSALLSLWKGHAKSNTVNVFNVSRWKAVLMGLRNVAYRRNQAITFNHMISISESWMPRRWFMTYDCDQFYSDAMIEKFSIANEDVEYGLLTGDELTFFNSFNEYTDEYEKRKYNNMPHKIYRNTMIRPTRGLVLEEWSCANVSLKNFLTRDHYIKKVKSLHIGEYFHYKLTSSPRFEAGYRLGDRKKPDGSQRAMARFEGKHPSIVHRYFKDRIECV